MKKYILFIIGAFTIQSCMVVSAVSSNVSEQYIKTNIQKHIPFEFNAMNLKTIYKNVSFEFVAFKTESSKGMLVRANKYYNLPKKVENETIIMQEYDFVVLNIDELTDVLTKLNSLSAKIEVKEIEHPNIEEYVDYTVSDDFFISYRKDQTSYDKPRFIQLWISGLKYKILASEFSENLQDAINFLK